jgi:hypothetical protein
MKATSKVLWPAFFVMGAWHASRVFARPAVYVPLPAAKYFQAGAESETSAFAPIDYYQSNCARCHGFYGTNYDLINLRKRDETSLKTVIHDMAQGPGQSPLDAEQLEIETAFHRSILAAQPFVAVAKIETKTDGVIISGEATPETKVVLAVGDSQYEAKRDGTNEHQWQVTLPAGTEEKNVQVKATIKDVSTTIALAETRYSHGKEQEKPHTTQAAH